MSGIGAWKQRLPRAENALPGRDTPLPLHNVHRVHGRPLQADFEGLQRVHFGMGCFWGAERRFWALPGVVTTAAGYAGGFTPNPTYQEVCSGLTGHAEVVLVVYHPKAIAFESLLQVFWESHDPTQGMRQGNDIGSQYRSVIHCSNAEQALLAQRSRDAYAEKLKLAGYADVTTEIEVPAPPFYYAEDAHQQYLHVYPDGYCGLQGTGVSCPVGIAP